ncbi:MAG: alpha/beta hydrolase [Niabella sp.]
MKNRNYHIYIGITFLILTLMGCEKKETLPAEEHKVYALGRSELNVAYGSHPLQKMDIYFPEGYSSGTPVVFVIHGGGFIAGTKEDFTERAKLFMSKGLVTVNISHRLVDATGLDQIPPPRIHSPVKVVDEVSDIAAAVEKYKSLAAGYGSGTAKMYMAGHSAGGTLAMLYVQGDKNTGKQVRASGNLAGLANLSLTDEQYSYLQQHEHGPAVRELLYRMTGAEPTKETALYLMAISPNWVSSANAPGMPNITVMSNTNDADLRFEPYFSTITDAQKYDGQLRSQGVKSEFMMMDTDHGFSRHPGDWEKAIAAMVSFFKQVN